jgi:transposase InsO family protein
MAGLGVSSSTAWLADSGASHHVCSDRAMFSNLHESRVKSVLTAKHGVAFVKGQGDVQLRVCLHGSSEVVAVCDVLYVPDFVANLLSVGKLADQGMPVAFVRDQCVLGPLEAPSAFAFRRNGLFCLSAESARNGQASDEGCGAVFATTVACPERAMLWHRRFGHLGFANLGVLQRHGLVRGLDVPQDVFAKFVALDCAVCQQTRPRQPRKSSDSKSTHVLQFVHSDVCGPMEVPSLGGARYLVTVLDDFSKLSVVKCIAAKRDVLTVLPAMIQLLETESGRQVQRLRSDRGGEYVNKVLADFAARKGIVVELIAGYSPESNGAAERLNRTLIERTRAKLLDASLPLSLWDEAVVAACHVRNRSPISETRAGTSWGLFFGAVPDVSHLRMFWL